MMLVKFLPRTSSAKGLANVGILEDGAITPLLFEGAQYRTLADILEDDDVFGTAQLLADRASRPIALDQVAILPPIDHQEVWAAGVTYRRSQEARMAESETSASCYDLVYKADRPELFFKANPHRVAGHRQPIRIRKDSQWNVPEPELALVLDSKLRLVGYTIGNDVSSRDIEGANPLYLPQAKVYDQACALGPGIVLADATIDPQELGIRLKIVRGGAAVFQGETSTANLNRTFDSLIEYLGRETTFPTGAFLLTGTGVVPDDSFTLQSGDVVHIEIDQLGELVNMVG